MPDAIATLAEKISDYNVFNYLLPGSVFMIALNYVGLGVPFESNVTLFLITAYFVGMVLSRIGSLIIEPALLWARFVRFCDYQDFVEAERTDAKLTALSRENNTYRSMTAAFTVLLIVKATLLLGPELRYWRQIEGWAWPFALLLLFAFSHRKQSRYIVKRVASRK